MKAVAAAQRSERTPVDEAPDVLEADAWRTLPVHLQDFVFHLHESGGRDLAGAAQRLGVSSSTALEICARKDVAAALAQLGVRVGASAGAPTPTAASRAVPRGPTAPRPAAPAAGSPAPTPRRLDLAAMVRALLEGKTIAEAARAAGSRATKQHVLDAVTRNTLRRYPHLMQQLEEAGWENHGGTAPASSPEPGAPAAADPSPGEPVAATPPAGTSRGGAVRRPPSRAAGATGELLTLTVTPGMHKILEGLLATGLYGFTVEDVAYRLLGEALGRLCEGLGRN